VAVFVTLGVALRLAEYLANFSLNHDDICLALNVITRGARGLMHTLDFEQAAPLAFYGPSGSPSSRSATASARSASCLSFQVASPYPVSGYWLRA